MMKMSICRLGSLIFPCALASLVILTLVQQTQQKQAQEIELAAPRERGFRQSLTRMSPVVLRVEPCHGFAEQQLQLAKALLVGSTLGAQVALPKASSKRGDNVWDLFDMPLLLESAQSIFRNIMCERPPGAERRFWCKETPVPAILLLEADQWTSLTNGRDRFQIDNVEELDFLYNRLWRSRPSMSIVSATCSTLLHLPVIEPGVRWDLFWQLFSSIEFTQDVQTTARRIAQLMPTYAESAQKNAASMGYETNQDKAHFNVLHLRAEPDWYQFCSAIFVPKGQSNCMNNTFEVANVLLFEGITPSIPLYLATGLNGDQLASWRSASTLPFATQSLFKVYTLVTQEMLSEVIFNKWNPDCRHHKMFWPAISFLLGMEAAAFIGNSVSTFSGLLLQRRARNKQRSIYYNGGGVWLQETGQLKAKQRLAPRTLRSRIKWIFCIHPEKGDPRDVESPRFKAAKVAIKSALSKTTLVPVGVTTADPRSKFAATLLAMGTRLIYHIPRWGSQIKSMKVKNERDKNSRTKMSSSEFVETVGRLLYLDIPILGIPDSFVFYTEVDVLFQNDVSWARLLGEQVDKFKRGNDFSIGQQLFTGPGKQGLPEFFSMSAGTKQVRRTQDSGVMLLNLLSLRSAYPAFARFILSNVSQSMLADSADQTGETGGASDAYQIFFQSNGKSLAAFLPLEFSWKPYWPKDPTVSVVHFLGPKCESDILPYINHRRVQVPLFKSLLQLCDQEANCRELCDEYTRQLRWKLAHENGRGPVRGCQCVNFFVVHQKKKFCFAIVSTHQWITLQPMYQRATGYH